jgi:putative two-component system response regulator
MPSCGRILVVDDYAPIVAGMRDLLERAGYTVDTASTGGDALRAAEVGNYDVILLDIVMPDMSGIEVCRELKRREATRLTPVVLITASQDRVNRLAGIETGADDFLNKPIDPDELRARVRSLLRVRRLTHALESAETLFDMLGRIVEARDPYTEGHCERLAHYATALGVELGLAKSDLDILYRGAFLHDIGKIGIPDRVLLKQTRLDAEEYELMKQHPVIGDKLCSTVRSLEGVRPIVRSHHERLDGRGYPDHLTGERIPLLATIVSIVDVFDALTTERPYRKALATETAYEMLMSEAESGWCSTELVETFVRLHRSTGHVTLPESSAVGTVQRLLTSFAS